MPTSFKMIGIGLLLTLIGFVLVQQELRLKIWGKTIVADVLDDHENTSRRSGEATSLNIRYRFIDEKNEAVVGSANVPLDYKGESNAPAGEDVIKGMPRVQTVKVVYLPGKPEIRRLATEGAFKSYLTFITGIVLLLAGAAYFRNESVLDAHRQTAEDIEKAGQPPDPRKMIKKAIGIGRNL